MGTTRSLDSIISRCSVTRELKQRRRQRWRKRHPKSEFALLKLHCYYPNSFNLSNDGYFFFRSWILKGCIWVHERKKKIGVLCSRKIRKFHVVVVQRRQRNVQKKRDISARLLFYQSKPIVFSRSRWRRRRRCLRSLMSLRPRPDPW